MLVGMYAPDDTPKDERPNRKKRRTQNCYVVQELKHLVSHSLSTRHHPTLGFLLQVQQPAFEVW